MSRGFKNAEEIWLNGPKWLGKCESEWPKTKASLNNEIKNQAKEEYKAKSKVLATTSSIEPLFDEVFSCYVRKH